MYAILALDTLSDTKCKITMLSHSTNDSRVLFQPEFPFFGFFTELTDSTETA